MIIGNFIADSIQGNQFKGLTPPIIKGVMLHRKIDTYTDRHPVYLSSKRRFQLDFDKYSGVLMDVIYDHFLAKHFQHYSSVSLQHHANSVYDLLKNHYSYLPESAKRFYHYMTKYNVLVNYASLKGIETVLTHLSSRIRNRYALQTAIPLLKKDYEGIEQEFFVFFEGLMTFCKQQEEVIDA